MLLSRGFIRETDKPLFSVITAKGIWEIERRKEYVSVDQLIAGIDNKFFDVFEKARSLSEKEKIIILAMIAIRSFSETTALDLKKHDRVLEVMQKIILSAYKLLKDNHAISKLKEDEIFGSKGNEHPVSNVIRHTDGLVKKSRGLYKSLGRQCYYLDLSNESEISQENLTFLFDLICGPAISDVMVDSLNNFCRKTAYEESVHLFDFSKATFINPRYDEIIARALDNCLFK